MKYKVILFTILFIFLMSITSFAREHDIAFLDTGAKDAYFYAGMTYVIGTNPYCGDFAAACGMLDYPLLNGVMGHGFCCATWANYYNKDAKIFSVKVFDDMGANCTVTQISDGIKVVMDQSDAPIISMSLGETATDISNSAYKNALKPAMDANKLIDVAAGNGYLDSTGNWDVQKHDASGITPANIEELNTIGVIDANGNILYNYGSCVDFYMKGTCTSYTTGAFSGWASRNSGELTEDFIKEGMSDYSIYPSIYKVDVYKEGDTIALSYLGEDLKENTDYKITVNGNEATIEGIDHYVDVRTVEIDSLGDKPASTSSKTNQSSSGSEESIKLYSGKIDEEELKGLPDESELTKEFDMPNLPDSDSLSAEEMYNLQNMQEISKGVKEFEIVGKVRVGIVFIGLCVIIYSILLGLAAIFDKVNSFVNISLVSILTFGKVKIFGEYVESGNNATVKKFIVVDIILLFIGIFLVSGGLMVWLYRFIGAIKNLF